MHGYINRYLEKTIKGRLSSFPAVAILGSRQCGKSTLARNLINNFSDCVYLDLEKPSDQAKLYDAEAFFTFNRGKLCCLDEIQREPEIFPLLRSVIDSNGKNGQFLLLGSSSRELIRQTSESLAGRICFIELTPFNLLEIRRSTEEMHRLWLSGGYPRSFLSEKDGYQWRTEFIRTFLEQEIPLLGFNYSSAVIERLWRFSAHIHGQNLNLSKLGESLGVSYHSVKNYLDFLEKVFMIRLLKPYSSNLKKRLVKSPKLYIRDSGLLHALLKIREHNDLFGHPVYGFSWEGFAMENIISLFNDWEPSFYRTSNGAEIDLILEHGRQKIAVEFKSHSAPSVNSSFYEILAELDISDAYVIAPVSDPFPLKNGVMVMNPLQLIEKYQKH